MALGVYPDLVRIEPGFTRELLWEIRAYCESGKPIDDEHRAYLAEAIKRLGQGLPPARAFFLAGRPGARRRTLGMRNIEIYNRVERLCEAGSTINGAYAKIAGERLGAKSNGKGQLSPDAIKKIHLQVKRLTHTKGKNRKSE